MPRPKVDRVIRSVRLPADLDALLVRHAQAREYSVNQAIEAAVRAFLLERLMPTVTPRFKK